MPHVLHYAEKLKDFFPGFLIPNNAFTTKHNVVSLLPIKIILESNKAMNNYLIV